MSTDMFEAIVALEDATESIMDEALSYGHDFDDIREKVMVYQEAIFVLRKLDRGKKEGGGYK